MNGIATVVAARMNSSRLPGKALLELGGVPILQFIIERIRQTNFGGPVILATTHNSCDDVLVNLAKKLDVVVFRGDENDVAYRFLSLAQKYSLDWIIRVTADCPFVDSDSLDYCLSQRNDTVKADLFTTKKVFPVGIDYELFSTKILEREWCKMTLEEREHLTLRFYRREVGIIIKHFQLPKLWPETNHSFTIDTLEDYRKASQWVQDFGSRVFSVHELLLHLSGSN